MKISPLLLTPFFLVASLVAAGLLIGLDRRLTARLQGRQGPPLLQPFWDVIKLMAKESAVVNPWLAFCARASFAAAAAAFLLFILQANLLLLLFVSASSEAFLVLGAMSVHSPYSHTAAQRQLWQMLCCETFFFSLAAAVFVTSGTLQLGRLPTEGSPLLLRAPLLYLGFLFALLIKMKKSPFDLAAGQHAHQELVRGIYTEYGGPHLAWVELAHWLEMLLALALCTLFWNKGWGGILLSLLSFSAALVIDTASCRLTWRRMSAKVLPFMLGAAFLSIWWLNG